MKKIINDPKNIVDEMATGLILAYPSLIRVPLTEKGQAIIARKNKKVGKVALVSGGGSGHEPAHAGYVGQGMLDAAVCGAIFTSPTPDTVCEAIKAVQTDKGVLLVIKNYTGDIMNFEMAMEMAELEGIKTAKVVVNDDVAVMNSTWTSGRRGIAGTVFVHKIAGAAAEAGLDLDYVQKIGERVNANVRSMGLALSPCIVPEAGKPGFILAEDELEIGLGIHGEPGVSRGKIKKADELVEELLERVLADNPIKQGEEVALIVNGLGGTPLMELFIANKATHDILVKKGIRVHQTIVGNYMTAIEMAGFSLSVLKLDAELKKFLDTKADTPAYRMFGL
ncbi:MAG: dihydroxyacetone kinase subunit DhaK [Spirochaetaceae bacterium]|jgi:dihydroxyacetone kinase-like protein|nr:dihydroxyacetone kinase subunit DhaK [Spirochaetaceae bacterium]